jgi:hypothetical protein
MAYRLKAAAIAAAAKIKRRIMAKLRSEAFCCLARYRPNEVNHLARLR